MICINCESKINEKYHCECGWNDTLICYKDNFYILVSQQIKLYLLSKDMHTNTSDVLYVFNEKPDFKTFEYFLDNLIFI
jgi:hypothetical protein